MTLGIQLRGLARPRQVPGLGLVIPVPQFLGFHDVPERGMEPDPRLGHRRLIGLTGVCLGMLVRLLVTVIVDFVGADLGQARRELQATGDSLSIGTAGRQAFAHRSLSGPSQGVPSSGQISSVNPLQSLSSMSQLASASS